MSSSVPLPRTLSPPKPGGRRLKARGLLDSTLVVWGGEFGRTPKVSLLPEHYKLPGRDHWGAVQTVFFAGGGVRGVDGSPSSQLKTESTSAPPKQKSGVALLGRLPGGGPPRNGLSPSI